MKYRIQRFSVHQSSKVVAVLYWIFGILYAPFMLLANAVSTPEEKLPALLIWLLPIILLIVGYVTTALLLGIYNGVARPVGGVELTLTSEPEE